MPRSPPLLGDGYAGRCCEEGTVNVYVIKGAKCCDDDDELVAIQNSCFGSAPGEINFLLGH